MRGNCSTCAGQFGTKQHSIVQRLLKALRKKAAEKLIAQEPHYRKDGLRKAGLPER
jgi:hypothetical protein